MYSVQCANVQHIVIPSYISFSANDVARIRTGYICKEVKDLDKVRLGQFPPTVRCHPEFHSGNRCISFFAAVAEVVLFNTLVPLSMPRQHSSFFLATTTNNDLVSSLWRKQPELVVNRLLKRAEITTIARRLQTRLALAEFKTKHGWENLPLDSIELKVEEMRRKPLCDGDILSDSSSSAPDLPYSTRTLSSSPLKALLSSDAISPSNVNSGDRKRKYIASFHRTMSSPSKRFRASPTPRPPFSGHSTWRDSLQLAQSSLIERGRLSYATASASSNVPHAPQRLMMDKLKSPDFAAPSNERNDPPAPSFRANNMCCSPPRTPPMQTQRPNSKRNSENFYATNRGKTGEDGAYLLPCLDDSPSTVVRTNTGRTKRPSATPPRNNKLNPTSSMMSGPDGGNLFPSTPGQDFDFADFINITPSPVQKQWKTPEPGRTI